MSEQPALESNRNRAQEIFKSSQEELKELIKAILNEERKVMHKNKRSNIHQKIYDHVKRTIR
jgi:hypothetical protein